MISCFKDNFRSDLDQIYLVLGFFMLYLENFRANVVMNTAHVNMPISIGGTLVLHARKQEG
jgi:hypothetical protein